MVSVVIAVVEALVTVSLSSVESKRKVESLPTVFTPVEKTTCPFTRAVDVLMVPAPQPVHVPLMVMSFIYALFQTFEAEPRS